MALTLMFANQLLVATTGDGLAKIGLGGNMTVDIESYSRFIRTARSGSAQNRQNRQSGTSKVDLSVKFGNLPRPAQQWYRKQVNIAYKRLVERTPKQEVVRGHGLIPTKIINGREVRVNMPIRYRDVPTPRKPEITDETVIPIITSSQYNGYPSLKVGKDLVIRIENKDVDFSHRTFVVGKITDFTIITPASR